MTRIASEALGAPVDRVTARLGDSRLPKAPVEGGSYGAASTGAAVHLACTALGKKLFDAASKIDAKPLGDAAFEDLAFIDGRLQVAGDPTRFVTLEDAVRASGQPTLEAEETARPGLVALAGMAGVSGPFGKSRNTHSAVFAEVRVDEELQVVRVTRIVVAVAAGRIINPKTARSQVVGGVVMGIGMALHEESLIDPRYGRFMNHNLADYHVPSNADIDSIEVMFVDEHDHKVSPLGVKGVGELGIVGTAAAVANAIFHATGKRVRELPITIDKLL